MLMPSPKFEANARMRERSSFVFKKIRNELPLIKRIKDAKTVKKL